MWSSIWSRSCCGKRRRTLTRRRKTQIHADRAQVMPAGMLRITQKLFEKLGVVADIDECKGKYAIIYFVEKKDIRCNMTLSLTKKITLEHMIVVACIKLMTMRKLADHLTKSFWFESRPLLYTLE
jgi:hypothetical protein